MSKRKKVPRKQKQAEPNCKHLYLRASPTVSKGTQQWHEEAELVFVTRCHSHFVPGIKLETEN